MGSMIKNCYIKTDYTDCRRSYIIYNSKDSVIENCFIQKTYDSELVLNGNNVTKYINNITNISHSNDPNSPNSQHIKFSADFFDRCKTQLKWDFDKVWVWDNASNEPYLQKNQNAKPAIPEEPVKDLPKTKVTLNKLTQQLNNNIWLSH
jgi:hypothetical protein